MVWWEGWDCSQQFQGHGGSSWAHPWLGKDGQGRDRGSMWTLDVACGLGVLKEPLWLIQAVTQREAEQGICLRLAFSLTE